MTTHVHTNESTNDPNGSIFLFEPLTQGGYESERFAMLTNRGPYRGMDHKALECIDELLRFRLVVTRRIAETALSTSDII